MLNKLITDRLLKCLDQLEKGSLSLTLPNGQSYKFSGKLPGANADIQIHDWRVPTNLAFKGDTGLAEDYRDGRWQSDNLENLITLAIDNDHVMSPFLYGSTLAQKIGNLSYILRSNTIKGSRRNISAHYDLGNDFYKLWLDPTMTYSSALFNQPDESLVQAQHNKYDRILGQLNQNSGSILEVGCGWGGFAERAASKGDFAIKGITLSSEQHDYAASRLDNKAKIVLEDYRAQSGTFDNIVSIEMFEAVGEKYWKTYFDKMGSMLKKSGRAVIQTITIDDKIFENYRTSNDFIRTFIFPGGMLPGPDRFAMEAKKSGLRINDRFDFGQDYATTLEHWLASFDSKKQEIMALGYEESFIRMWRFYLAACIASFRTGRTNVMQVELQHA